MSIGITNYNTKRKNEWRNEIWRQIAMRVERPRDAKIIYLPAKQDLDRIAAARWGFDKKNMIAVDSDLATVDALRKSGKTVIHADFAEVAAVGGWDVVYADLCSGMTETAEYLSNQCSLGVHDGSVFAINLLRGREKKNKTASMNRALWMVDGPEIEKSRRKDLIKKHRGVLFLCSYQTCVGNALSHAFFKTHGEVVLRYVLDEAWKMHNAFFSSYKSIAGNQFFDSVVFCPANPRVNFAEPISEARTWQDIPMNYSPATARKVAAAKAVLTMRKKGVLKCAS